MFVAALDRGYHLANTWNKVWKIYGMGLHWSLAYGKGGLGYDFTILVALCFGLL
jgi:hypothetical protein